MWSGNIKFRAYNKKYGLKEPFTLKSISEFDCSNDGCGQYKWQDDTIFMQFTTLIDKNRKEIYEGDIIKVTTEFYGTFKCKVEFFKGVFGYMNICCICIENKEGWDKDHDMVNSGWFLGGFSPLNGDGYAKHKSMDQIEIIGNIHENPDLL